MLKRAAAAAAIVVAVATGLYVFAGWRLVLDGSGMWPRIDYAPDFDALDAERARQQQASRLATPAAEPLPSTVVDAPATSASSARISAESERRRRQSFSSGPVFVRT